MSKWRPKKLNCLYVIPDVHGAHDLLELILRRILPLRKSDGGKDKIIFLGDYIDRGKDGHKVLDRLIELKKKYGERVICLCGNHELMLLEALEYIPSDSPSAVHNMWMNNGGLNTIAGYLERIGSTDNVFSLNRDRIKSLIPKEHIDFMMNDLDGSYEEGNFTFVHGGCEPDESPSKYEIRTLAWDRSLFRFVLALIEEERELPWENKIVITGHNAHGGIPIIKDKFMMLDCGSPKKLLVVEAHTRQAFMSLPGKSKLVRFDLKETVKPKGSAKPSVRRIK